MHSVVSDPEVSENSSTQNERGLSRASKACYRRERGKGRRGEKAVHAVRATHSWCRLDILSLENDHNTRMCGKMCFLCETVAFPVTNINKKFACLLPNLTSMLSVILYPVL